ncbi:hypothetical protein UFOVP671_40 [uncultured Caudovirales phage]|uniref:Uncharacterized protein n=1 Tax=uncultured Caudovirales phage TaxID=2100421 RepID=A0A6J5NB39_9CAUD|nr:hypothetical protein UFOVP671_40 [uncultured Caudovirales phage]
MGYTKNGSFTMNKNPNKVRPNQPDYKGSGFDLEGNPIWISAWLKTDHESGREFFSCSFQPRDAEKMAAYPTAATHVGAPAKPPVSSSDDITF